MDLPGFQGEEPDSVIIIENDKLIKLLLVSNKLHSKPIKSIFQNK